MTVYCGSWANPLRLVHDETVVGVVVALAGDVRVIEFRGPLVAVDEDHVAVGVLPAGLLTLHVVGDVVEDFVLEHRQQEWRAELRLVIALVLDQVEALLAVRLAEFPHLGVREVEIVDARRLAEVLGVLQPVIGRNSFGRRFLRGRWPRV